MRRHSTLTTRFGREGSFLDSRAGESHSHSVLLAGLGEKASSWGVRGVWGNNLPHAVGVHAVKCGGSGFGRWSSSLRRRTCRNFAVSGRRSPPPIVLPSERPSHRASSNGRPCGDNFIVPVRMLVRVRRCLFFFSRVMQSDREKRLL